MPTTELETPTAPVESTQPAAVQESTPAPATTSEVAALLELARQTAACAEEQRLLARKQLFFTRIFALTTVAILVVVLLVCAVLGPRINTLLGDAVSIVSQADAIAADLKTVTAQLASSDIPGILQNVNQLVTDGQAGITQALSDVERAIQVLEAVDISKLNESINNLNQVIAPLSKLFGK